MWHLVPYSRSDASTNESSILHVNAVDHLMCLGYQQVVLLFLEIVGWCVKDEISLSELYLFTGHTHLFRVIVYIQMQRLTCLFLHLHVEDISILFWRICGLVQYILIQYWWTKWIQMVVKHTASPLQWQSLMFGFFEKGWSADCQNDKGLSWRRAFHRSSGLDSCSNSSC